MVIFVWSSNLEVCGNIHEPCPLRNISSGDKNISAWRFLVKKRQACYASADTSALCNKVFARNHFAAQLSVSIFASRQNSKAHYCMCFLVWIGLFRRMSPNSGLTFSFASIIFSVQNFWRLVIRAKSYYKLSTTNHNMIWCFHISPSCVCISKKYYLLSYFYNENVHI